MHDKAIFPSLFNWCLEFEIREGILKVVNERTLELVGLQNLSGAETTKETSPAAKGYWTSTVVKTEKFKYIFVNTDIIFNYFFL